MSLVRKKSAPKMIAVVYYFLLCSIYSSIATFFHISEPIPEIDDKGIFFWYLRLYALRKLGLPTR